MIIKVKKYQVIMFVIIALVAMSVSFYKIDNYIMSSNALNSLKEDDNLSILDSEEMDLATACMVDASVPEIELVLYEGPIKNIFFHSLIVYPELAFDGGKHQTNYNYWMVTVSEFKKIIAQLYERDYVLIDSDLLYEIKTVDGINIISEKQLYIPKGKKPLLLTIDDLSYYNYMDGDGFADRLVLDSNGNVCTLTKTLDGKEVILQDNDCVPIVDKFVEEHPDFSYNNAKGVIALTGYDGIFGYRTDILDSKSYGKESNTVKEIASTLKANGWKFASHSYGHINIPKRSMEKLKLDTTRWNREVASLIGKTDHYIYPYGAKVNPNSSRLNYLKQSGFNIFWGVGNNSNFRIVNNSIHMERLNIDGYKMHYAPNALNELFNVKEVYDSRRPAFKK